MPFFFFFFEAKVSPTTVSNRGKKIATTFPKQNFPNKFGESACDESVAC